MIFKPFYRRHFFLMIAVFAALLWVTSYLTHYLNHLERVDNYRAQGEAILKNIEQQTGDKVEYIKALNAHLHDLGFMVDVDLLDNGKSLVTGESKPIPEAELADGRIFILELKMPEKTANLVVNFSRAQRRSMQWTFIGMLVAIVLGSGLSLLFLFWSLRERNEIAKVVLSRMQNGDLKARFPTARLDEFGQTTALFNQMADEIERLVERLKQNERLRLQLMQELTHDLRTPISSLRNLIETLRFDGERLPAKSKGELMELAYQESEYLTRLVEDLLFLALVLEPKYKNETGEVFVQDLLQAQMSAAATAFPEIKFKLLDGGLAHSKLSGNSHLLQRLFRNAFENAFSFARSHVEGHVQLSDGRLTITIRDDGPGFSNESLEKFGKKRTTRYQGVHKDGRLSVGLGSVIMQAIVEAHGGQVSIHNILDERGKVCGAELIIVLRSHGKNAA